MSCISPSGSSRFSWTDQRTVVRRFSQQKLTVLVPTNRAAAAINNYGVMQLQRVFTFHLLPGLNMYYDLRPAGGNTGYPTVDGTRLFKVSQANGPTVLSGSNNGGLNHAMVLKGDLFLSTTAVAHGIDTLLTPPGLN